MNRRYSRRTRDGSDCKGEIRVADGVLSVDCTSCRHSKDISDPSCLNGLSGRILPGFKGDLVLEGKVHRSFEGASVEALSSHSSILNDIRRFASGPDIDKKKLLKIVRRMETDFLMDPVLLEVKRSDYLKDIRRALKSREAPEVERFESIVEASSIMVKRLERDISRSG